MKPLPGTTFHNRAAVRLVCAQATASARTWLLTPPGASPSPFLARCTTPCSSSSQCLNHFPPPFALLRVNSGEL